MGIEDKPVLYTHLDRYGKEGDLGNMAFLRQDAEESLVKYPFPGPAYVHYRKAFLTRRDQVLSLKDYYPGKRKGLFLEEPAVVLLPVHKAPGLVST